MEQLWEKESRETEVWRLINTEETELRLKKKSIEKPLGKGLELK